MAARYQHLSPAFLADAVARLDSAYGFAASAAQLPPLEQQQTNEAAAD